MINILYISYTGLMDPLGQSQVLQYVIALAQEHKMILLTFEKPENLKDSERYNKLKKHCEFHGVSWHALKWNNKPRLLGTIFDIVRGAILAVRLAKAGKVDIAHCRSYIASLMGLAVKWKVGARFIFDMRGFWPDERVDGGIWSRRSFPYLIFKVVERYLFLAADHVVSLTKSGAREFAAFEYLADRLPPVSVIPTCTNLDLFQSKGVNVSGFTLGYIGSVGSWYMFDDVAKAVSRLFAMRDDARFLIINKGGHEMIRTELHDAGVDMSRVEIREAAFDEVPEQISRMDAGIFFIKPAWSKRASCPTRMGEFLACGKPCLANNGVGDVQEDFSDTNTGITLPTNQVGHVDMRGLDSAIEKLLLLSREPDISQRCRAVAEDRFSLERGVAEYSRIYRTLAHKVSSVHR